MPLSVYAASYPDFTEIVEQNMPAVVIVNATRSTNPNSSNQFQTPPGMPDEFNDLFKKFFDERQNQPRKSQLTFSRLILSLVKKFFEKIIKLIRHARRCLKLIATIWIR